MRHAYLHGATVGRRSLRTTAAWRAILLTVTAGEAAHAQTQEPEHADAPVYALGAAYTADVWRNLHGGLRTGGAYLDNLDLTLGIDGERAWGWSGLTAFVYVLYNNSARFSERYVGDAMTASNIDAPHGVRLHEAWLDWESRAPQPLSLRVGLYDLNSEFDTTESRSLFIHSTHGIGHELGQTGHNGPSIFPVTSLGARLAWQPASGWRVLAAVLDAVPGDRDEPDHSGIDLSSEEGALAITEAQWSGGRINKLSIGYWQYSADFADVRASDAALLPERDDNRGGYLAVEVALDGAAREGGSRTAAFVRYGVANGKVNEFDRSLGLGLRQRGIVAARPNDELGLAFAYAAVSEAARDAGSAMQAPRDRYEAAFELTYRVPINDWLTLQPDLQFNVNPGADPSLADSFAVGLRFELSWSGAL